MKTHENIRVYVLSSEVLRAAVIKLKRFLVWKTAI